MATTEQTETQRILAERARYVARGVSPRHSSSTARRAPGSATSTARSYIDFAGGIGCQNTGHGFAARRRGDPRAGRPLPPPVLHGRGATSRTSTSAGGLPSSRRARASEQKRVLVNSGAEAIENAVKIARAATGRPAVIVFDRRLPRPDAADDDDDEQARLQAGLRAVRAGGLPRAGAVPVPRRLDPTTRSTALEDALPSGRRPGVGRLRRARARAGRGRLHPDAARLPGRLRELLRRGTGSSTSTTRCRRASAARARAGRSSTTASSRTCSSPASRSAAACRSRASPGAPSVMDAVPPGRPRRHVRRQPALVRGRRRRARRGRDRPSSGARADELGERICAAGSRRSRRASRRSARCAGSARCSRSSSSTDRETKDAGGERREADDGARARARARPALVRPLRQRDPHPRADPRGRRGRGRGLSILEEALVDASDGAS